MPFKPNYNQQRAERNRAKEAKKLEKQQRREGNAKTPETDGEGQTAEPVQSDTETI